MRMKRISFLLVFVLLISSVAYGSFEDKIENHWSRGIVEEDFMGEYFQTLTSDDFASFDPNTPITIGDFSRSMSLLLKKFDYEIDIIDNEDPITRGAMVEILGRELESIKGPIEGDGDIAFKDINTMDSSSIDLLRLLYKLEIINGDNNTQFSPNRTLSQAEAIIILQRLRGVLNTMDTISFETLGVVQSFNGKEEITVIPQKDKILVTITKEFPTPGYDMEIKNITKLGDGYRIYFNLEEPPKDSIQLQVITYKTISLEIDKEFLGDMPYNFILEGYNIIK